ncbi:MAG TPA: hypothetical protein VN175_12780 [Rhizomicrobium sp.]|nr:hypothetical protein [Rhizomicrobium sp.]
MRVRTVTLLLLFLWGLSFAVGAYEIYGAWADHQGPHGAGALAPLGLPETLAPPVTRRPNLRLGS